MSHASSSPLSFEDQEILLSLHQNLEEWLDGRPVQHGALHHRSADAMLALIRGALGATGAAVRHNTALSVLKRDLELWPAAPTQPSSGIALGTTHQELFAAVRDFLVTFLGTALDPEIDHGFLCRHCFDVTLNAFASQDGLCEGCTDDLIPRSKRRKVKKTFDKPYG